jgi:hypothetical protein
VKYERLTNSLQRLTSVPLFWKTAQAALSQGKGNPTEITPSNPAVTALRQFLPISLIGFFHCGILTYPQN